MILVKVAIGGFRKVWSDKATRYSFGAQLMQIVGGPLALLLVIAKLDETEQGIYYAFGSILMLRAFFDLGFSFAIIQAFAHEFAALKVTSKGFITGNRIQRNRLAGFFAFSRKWCFAAGILFLPVVGFGGHAFLSNTVGDSNLQWTGPWWCLSIVTAGNLAVAFWGLFLAGTGRIADSYRISLVAETLGNIVLVSSLIGGAGLWAPALLASTRLLTYLIECLRVWAGPFHQMWRMAGRCAGIIQFTREILPFQARLALSWSLGYFTSYLFTPAVLYYHGASAAGRFGAAAQIVNMIGAISATWVSVKAPHFGTLTASGDTNGLEKLFGSTSRRALFSAAILLCSVIGGLLLVTMIDKHLPNASHLQTKLHSLINRFSGPETFLYYGLGMVAWQYLNATATCLRARKEEPFLALMGLQAAITVGLIVVLVPLWADAGAALSYGVSMILSAACAHFIYRRITSIPYRTRQHHD